MTEVRVAIKSWALFNAMNGNEHHKRKELQLALNHLKLSDKMIYMRLVMATDTIMAIFRVTEQKGKDKLTFCTLARDLADAEFLEQIFNYHKNKNLNLNYFDQVYENNSRIYAKEFLEIFPKKWDKSNSNNLTNKKILKFRENYKDIRDKLLAHSVSHANLKQPTIDEISQTIELLSIQASQVHYIYSGNSEQLNEFSKIQQKESLELWNTFEEGLSRVVNTDKADSTKK
ncbi:MAG: hypothetical protein ACRBBJ_03195 [Rhodomicrobiaceae bacterium]